MTGKIEPQPNVSFPIGPSGPTFLDINGGSSMDSVHQITLATGEMVQANPKNPSKTSRKRTKKPKQLKKLKKIRKLPKNKGLANAEPLDPEQVLIETLEKMHLTGRASGRRASRSRASRRQSSNKARESRARASARKRDSEMLTDAPPQGLPQLSAQKGQTQRKEVSEESLANAEARRQRSGQRPTWDRVFYRLANLDKSSGDFWTSGEAVALMETAGDELIRQKKQLSSGALPGIMPGLWTNKKVRERECVFARAKESSRIDQEKTVVHA